MKHFIKIFIVFLVGMLFAGVVNAEQGDVCLAKTINSECTTCCAGVDGVINPQAGDANKRSFYAVQIETVIPARITAYTDLIDPSKAGSLKAQEIAGTIAANDVSKLRFYETQVNTVLPARRDAFRAQRATLDMDYCKSQCPIEYALAVTKQGTGTGTITSTSMPTQATQINCGTTCTTSFSVNTDVTLSAQKDTGSDFAGWSGAVPATCTPTGTPPTTCTVKMDAVKAVTATFTQAIQATNKLTVNLIQPGQVEEILPETNPRTYKPLTKPFGPAIGKVMSTADSSIDCGSDCIDDYATSVASVVLTASFVSGSAFSGWSGACTGTTATCTVQLPASQPVTATFTCNLGSSRTLDLTGAICDPDKLNDAGTMKIGCPRGQSCELISGANTWVEAITK